MEFILNRNLLIILLFLISIKFSFTKTTNSDLSKNFYNDGLIFYNVETKEKILPPIILPFKLEDNCGQNRLPFIGEPCSCQNHVCGCCAGIKMPQYNFDREMCLNMSYVPEETAVNVFGLLNGQSIMFQTFSARNPAPLCMPLMVPLPLAMCLKITDMKFIDYNVHMCMSMVVRMGQTNEMFEMRFNCIKMGQNGFEYLDPSGNPVFPQNGNGFGYFSTLNIEDNNKEEVNAEFFDQVNLD